MSSVPQLQRFAEGLDFELVTKLVHNNTSGDENHLCRPDEPSQTS